MNEEILINSLDWFIRVYEHEQEMYEIDGSSLERIRDKLLESIKMVNEDIQIQNEMQEEMRYY